MDVSLNLTPGPDTVEHIRMAEALGLPAGLAQRLARALPRRLDDARAGRRADRAHRPRRLGRRAEPASRRRDRLRDRDPGGARPRPRRGDRRHRVHRAVPARPAPAVMGRGRALRDARCAALLDGDAVEVDGRLVQLCHPDGLDPRPPDRRRRCWSRPTAPKGVEVAREVGDGIMAMGEPQAGLRLVGVRLGGHRARTRRGPDARPGSSTRSGRRSRSCTTSPTRWRPPPSTRFPAARSGAGSIEDVPAERRHLALHEGHGVAPNERELPYLRSRARRRHVHRYRRTSSATGSTPSRPRA